MAFTIVWGKESGLTENCRQRTSKYTLSSWGRLLSPVLFILSFISCTLAAVFWALTLRSFFEVFCSAELASISFTTALVAVMECWGAVNSGQLWSCWSLQSGISLNQLPMILILITCVINILEESNNYILLEQVHTFYTKVRSNSNSW